MKIKKANEFGTLALDKLLEFEHKHLIQFPEDYRQFLLECNGGNPHPINVINFNDGGEPNSSDIHYFYGIHNGKDWARIEWNIKNYRGRILGEGIPIAGDSGGNQYVLLVKGKKAGHVFFWNHDGEPDQPGYENMSLIASSFTEFTEKLHEYIDPDEPESKRIIRENDVKGLEKLLIAGYDLESTDDHDRTLIEIAAIHNRPELIQILFDKGANLHNALQYALDNYKWHKEYKVSVDLLEKLQVLKGGEYLD